MRINGLLSSLAFGVAVSVALVFALHLASPLIGAWNALVAVLSFAAIGYCALIASTPRHVLRNATVAVFGCCLVALGSHEIAGLAIGLTSMIALVRSGLEYSTRPIRGFVLELVLGVLSLAFASWIASPGWLGLAAGLWGFALVQSVYFIVSGIARTPDVSLTGDAFERARIRLLQLLQETEGENPEAF